MPAPDRLDRPSALDGFLPVFLANLLPLVGVVVLGWDPNTLIVIYAVEVLFSFPLAAVKALFAQRPPRGDEDEAGVVSLSNELTRKRGSVELVSWLPPIYPRALPYVDMIFYAAGWVWLAIGLVLDEAVPLAAVLTRPEWLFGVLGLVAGQSIGTWREYFRDGGYETTTPYAVIETPAREGFFLLFVLTGLPPLVIAGGEVLVGVFVVFKLLVEWSAHRTSQGEGGRLAGWLAGPDEPALEADPVCVPASEPSTTFPTDDRAVAVTAVCKTLVTSAPLYVSGGVFLWIVTYGVLAGVGSPRAVAALSALWIVGIVVVLFVVNAATFYFKYAPLEYRRYGSRIVAYDRLLEEPQWSASLERLHDVAVVQDRIPDRLLGTRTISVWTGVGEESNHFLGPVTDGDALVEAFELPVRTTEHGPIDRRIAAAVAGCLVAIGVAASLAMIGGWTGHLLFGVFVFPVVADVFTDLWKRGYPEPNA